MATLGRMKAVIVGDSEVLKKFFQKQIAGLYRRNWDYCIYHFYMQEMLGYVLDIELYDKAVEVAIWDTGKFRFNCVGVIQSLALSR